MKIYLAARWERQAEMRGNREGLINAGHVCTSTWLDTVGKQSDGLGQPELHHAHATSDLADVAKSEVFVLFTESGAFPRGGRMVEFGYALALQRLSTVARGVVIIGARENIFCHLESVTHFETWEEFLGTPLCHACGASAHNDDCLSLKYDPRGRVRTT